MLPPLNNTFGQGNAYACSVQVCVPTSWREIVEKSTLGDLGKNGGCQSSTGAEGSAAGDGPFSIQRPRSFRMDRVNQCPRK